MTFKQLFVGLLVLIGATALMFSVTYFPSETANFVKECVTVSLDLSDIITIPIVFAIGKNSKDDK